MPTSSRQLMGLPTVVHLTSVHPPNDIRIFVKECKTLADAGYTVSLIAPGERDHERDGIAILAIPQAGSRIDRILYSTSGVLRRALHQEAAIFHFHDPELIPVGLLLKLRGYKVIYDAHEDVSADILDKQWIPPMLRWPIAICVSGLEKLGSRVFDQVVAATPAIARRFPAKRVTIVQNFPILDELVDASPVTYVSRPPTFVYIGGVSAVRGAAEMVDAIGMLSEDRTATLRIAGRIAPRGLEADLIARPGWKAVHLAGWLDRYGVSALLSEGRAGVVLFHPLRNHVESQPTKLFEYMSAGLPVIASDFPHWRQIVAGARCGILVDPFDVTAVAKAMQWILDHPDEAEAMGRRGMNAVRERYSWRVEGQRLIHLYDSLTNGRRTCAA